MLAEILQARGAIGAAAAIKANVLTAITGKSKRKIGEQAQKERDAGALILSLKGKAGGYFLLSRDEASARAELEAFERTEGTHARRVLATVSSLKRNAREEYGIDLFKETTGGAE